MKVVVCEGYDSLCKCVDCMAREVAEDNVEDWQPDSTYQAQYAHAAGYKD